MSDWLAWLLLLIFGLHLFAFAALWWRRRQGYYLALVATFLLLMLSVSLRVWGGAPDVLGRSMADWLRYGAWASAAISISWTVTRILRRRRQAGRQNSS